MSVVAGIIVSLLILAAIGVGLYLFATRPDDEEGEGGVGEEEVEEELVTAEEIEGGEDAPEPDGFGWSCLDCSGHSHSTKDYDRETAEEYAQRHETSNPGHRTVLVTTESLREAVRRRKEQAKEAHEEEESGAEPPFKCDHCDEEFKNPQRMGGHQSQCGEEDDESQTYRCGCGATFSSRNALWGHQASCSESSAETVEQAAEENSEDGDADGFDWLTSGEGSEVKWEQRVPCPRCDFSTDHKPGYGRHAQVVHGVGYEDLIDELQSQTNFEEPETEGDDSDATPGGHAQEPGEDGYVDPTDKDALLLDRAESAIRALGGGTVTTQQVAEKMNAGGQQTSNTLSRMARRTDRLESRGYGKWRYLADSDDERGEEGSESDEKESRGEHPGDPDKWENEQACPEPGCGFKTRTKSAMKTHAWMKHQMRLDVGQDGVEVRSRE